MLSSKNLAVGMTAELSIVVTPELTVGHFVQGMPQVYATPMMIVWRSAPRCRRAMSGTSRRRRSVARCVRSLASSMSKRRA
ncbi:hypothetical protein [Bradyrhizobium erythrophlei]|uniref:hypothetical protein n=1 Tax=Bradyrhizobium erythrophlei TaxID=1437360 RepID=UPI0026C8B10F